MKTYVINLDRSPDRWSLISDRLSAEGYRFERISAVDGTRLEDVSQYQSKLSRLAVPQGMNRLETAVYLSHMKAWQRILDDGEQTALVLEDDAVPIPGRRDIIESMNPEDFGLHMLRLHIYNYEKIKARNRLRKTGINFRGHDIHMTAGFVPSATAYLMTRAGAKLLLKRKKIVCPIDWLFFREMLDGLKHGACTPLLFNHDTDAGTIVQHMNDKRLLPRVYRRFITRAVIPLTETILRH